MLDRLAVHVDHIQRAVGCVDEVDRAEPVVRRRDELDLLVEAGLSRREALQTATVNAARVLGIRTGVIEMGADADFVLLAGNPLDDLAVLRDPVGVMVNGQWLSGEEELSVIIEDARSNQLSFYAACVRLVEHVIRNF